MVIVEGPGGTINPGGAVVVHGGRDQTFVMTPDGGAPSGAYFRGVGPEGEWSATTIMLDRWEAQTFTPTITFTASGVRLPLSRSGFPGYVYVTIRPTDGELGHPYTPDIAWGNFNADTELGDGAYGWYWCPFESDIELLAGTEYAIIVECRESPEGTAVYWAYEGGNGYPTGHPEESVNGGVAWTVPYEGEDDHDHPFDFRADTYFYVDQIWVDGTLVDATHHEIGEVVEYTFTDVMADHTIEVHFSESYPE